MLYVKFFQVPCTHNERVHFSHYVSLFPYAVTIYNAFMHTLHMKFTDNSVFLTKQLIKI